MDSASRLRRSATPVERGYRRVLVPVLENAESERAMQVACRLAAERHASVTALAVIEIPALLPFDAQMTEEEADARRLLTRVEVIADSYGVAVAGRTIRARDAAEAILERVDSDQAELIVMGARRRERLNKRAPVFGRTVQHVLRKATCRVMVVGSPG